MADFEFLQNPVTKEWVISAPRRAKRPDVAKGFEPVCPFCPGKEVEGEEVYRVPKVQNTQNSSEYSDSSESQNISESESQKVRNSDFSGSPSIPSVPKQVSNFDIRDSDLTGWLVRVITNKFPFASIHEIVIHSPDHHQNLDELPLSQVELVLQTYRQRYNTHKDKGRVCIFHNHGEAGGESLPHPHTQIAVVPFSVNMDMPRLDPQASVGFAPKPTVLDTDKRVVSFSSQSMEEKSMVESKHFYLFCPKTSQWPDEVWVAPKSRGRAFGEITDEEVADLAFTLQRVIQIFDLRHGSEFPFNFYIYPAGDWYLRLIPRVKTIGGFELITGIFVNTQSPQETMEFLKEHFESPDLQKIKSDHQAEYSLHV